MKYAELKEEFIRKALSDYENGIRGEKLYAKYGITKATFWYWRHKHGVETLGKLGIKRTSGRNDICGHLDREHYANGRCNECYHKKYYLSKKAKKEIADEDK